MRTLFVLLFMILALGYPTTIRAEMDHDKMQPYSGSVEFERLKTLEGHWEGTMTRGEEIKDVTVDYALTSNGSALVETLFPGESDEMVTVYHDKGGQLTMTHYCSIGNQPQMDLVKAEGEIYEFLLSPESDIDVATEGHMHALKISMNGENDIEHVWTMYMNGEPSDGTIALSRAVQE